MVQVQAKVQEGTGQRVCLGLTSRDKSWNLSRACIE